MDKSYKKALDYIIKNENISEEGKNYLIKIILVNKLYNKTTNYLSKVETKIASLEKKFERYLSVKP